MPNRSNQAEDAAPYESRPDIRRLFGDREGVHVADIGGGYGRHSLIADQVFRLHRHTIFDLPAVLALTRKYLET